METARRQSEDARPCQSVEQVVEAYTPGLRSFIRGKTPRHGNRPDGAKNRSDVFENRARAPSASDS